jgi:3-hydroxyisobutyrate dehydrogenase-like beta-hydroxyacid dehydrogenase
MGQAMARNLLKAGHRVFVFNRTRSRAEELRDEGAEVADSPAGACKGDIVITMLADDDAVEEIILGSGGVIRALRENAIHLSMSTITVGFSEVLTEAHYAAGSILSPLQYSGARQRGSSLWPLGKRNRSTAAGRYSTTSDRKHL